jgi:hypothetical protein
MKPTAGIQIASTYWTRHSRFHFHLTTDAEPASKILHVFRQDETEETGQCVCRINSTH